MQIDRLSMTAEDSDVVFRESAPELEQLRMHHEEIWTRMLRHRCDVAVQTDNRDVASGLPLISRHICAERDHFSPKTDHCTFGIQAGQIIGVYNMYLSMV